MPVFRLSINGERRRVDAPAAMPLLWVLRDRLGLVGTKYGCGIGACGACTVHVGRDAVRSCQLSVGEVGKRAVTTIEGLRAPCVRRAWLDEDVAQCGYCQPGQIMQAAALLAATPAPTDSRIDAEMAGNVCRCGTYPRIRAAIHRAAADAAEAVAAAARRK